MTNVTAPDGMSRTDTLKGLWDCSKPASFFGKIREMNRKSTAGISCHPRKYGIFFF
jgi:hypothetical protein